MKAKIIIVLCGILLSLCSCRSMEKLRFGEWNFTCNKDGVSITRGDASIVKNLSAEYKLDGKLINTHIYSTQKITSSKIDDVFGKGEKVIITYSDKSLPQLQQTFRIYEDYIFTDINLSADSEIETNYMAPIVISKTSSSAKESSYRALFVPFDNDAWIRFRSVPLKEMGDTLRSYEVTSIYDAESRNGILLGAIEHNTWKNAIDLLNNTNKIIVYSGVADNLTRDNRSHGVVRGKDIKSATMMIGVFDDWRAGMETYADVNAIVSPPRKWEKAMPVGWNSWGTLQFNVNHTNSTETAKFFADELQPYSFCNTEGQLYIGLDSGWNSFTEEELSNFASTCKSLNQIPCIYWTPFADWGKNPERSVPGAEQYKYKDIYLYANGNPQDLDGAYAIDPTHPAIKAMMEQTADLFRRCGYKYVKMDFMTHGRLEADNWYLKDITTGTEAYNYGMQLLDSIFYDMYLNLSIAPIFPAQYAQSRRIACDAWNVIEHTEYTMNALSYGWWIDRIYNYNDADHVVLRDVTEGENRARITSAVITGLFIVGDDFSSTGDSIVKDRAIKYLTNEDINHIANGKSFRPLLGNDERSEKTFIRTEPNGDVYLVMFNYTDDESKAKFPYEWMDLNPDTSYDITELWSHTMVQPNDEIVIPSKDVKVFLFKKQQTNII